MPVITLGKVTVAAKPKVFALQGNFPNPFNPVTEIRYDIPSKTDVRIEIYNVLGSRVRLLVNGEKKAGYYGVIWDGSDDAGTELPGGVYLCRMKAGDFSFERRMVLLK